MATERRHGTRTKYVWDGCRCDACKAANRRYSSTNQKARRAGVEPFVDPAKARAHLVALREGGMGLRRVSELSGVSRSALLDLAKGNRCTPYTEARILRVSLDEWRAPGAYVDAAQTWRRVNELLTLGWTKAAISARIGQGGRALQLGKRQVTQRNAAAIFRLWVEQRDHLGVWE